MITQSDILYYLQINRELFRTKYDVEKIGIFGSYARNEQTENSDIDIIIDMPVGTENIFEKRLLLKDMISNFFSKPVDVCHQRAIKPIFKEMILKDAIYV